MNADEGPEVDSLDDRIPVIAEVVAAARAWFEAGGNQSYVSEPFGRAKVRLRKAVEAMELDKMSTKGPTMSEPGWLQAKWSDGLGDAPDQFHLRK